MHFTKTLTYWYSTHKRDLPWRRTKDPYHIWLSEIIMQQTQVSQGLPYYKAFVKVFPTVFALAKAEEQDVLKLWQGLGYYSRARNLHFTAKTIVTNYNGLFPETYSELLKLKGIGDYTASAIASICFDQPTAVVDGNVYRVLSRYFGIDTPINSTKGIKEFKALAQQLLPKSNFGDYNQAIMEFGAKQCQPKNPDCTICPLNDSCAALEKNMVKVWPVKLKKTKIKKRYFNYLVFVFDDNTTVIQQRKDKGIWQNLYEFPLLETEKSLTHDQLSKYTELSAFLDWNSDDVSLFNTQDIIHKLSHQHLHTKFWIVRSQRLAKNRIMISKVHTLPVPILISNFLDSFNFKQ